MPEYLSFLLSFPNSPSLYWRSPFLPSFLLCRRRGWMGASCAMDRPAEGSRRRFGVNLALISRRFEFTQPSTLAFEGPCTTTAKEREGGRERERGRYHNTKSSLFVTPSLSPSIFAQVKHRGAGNAARAPPPQTDRPACLDFPRRFPL